METKHTQGNWDVTAIYNNPLSDDKLYIINKGSSTSLKEMQANAKLIAAAPDLLEALQAMIDGKERDFSKLVEKAQAAIKKATE